jgi:hypothetical protein
MSAERPILFSAPMVRALNRADAPKTQTRRAVEGEAKVRLLRTVRSDVPSLSPARATPGIYTAHLNQFAAVSVTAQDGGLLGVKPDEFEWICPYGQVGDRLWVRETWRTACGLDDLKPTEIGEKAVEAGAPKPWAPIQYAADEATDNGDVLDNFGGDWGKTRVSIHMPRWASRTTLEITKIRLQPLKAITEADAAAEGLIRLPASGRYVVNAGAQYFGLAGSATSVYAHLWDEINGEGAFGLNPFVWALTFKRVPQEGK